jgi:EpsI family protein
VIPRIAVALAFAGLSFYVFRFMATTEIYPERALFQSFPSVVGEWRCDTPLEMSDDIIGNLGVTDYLLCDFRNERTSQMANVYIGYHESQTRNVAGTETVIHPPEHCLPGGGWDIIQSEVVPTPWFEGGEAKRVVIAKGNQRNLVYFWYQSSGRVIARNHEKVIYMFLDRAFHQRTDGSLVRFTVPIIQGDEKAAAETMDSIVSSVTPILDQYIPN